METIATSVDNNPQWNHLSNATVERKLIVNEVMECPEESLNHYPSKDTDDQLYDALRKCSHRDESAIQLPRSLLMQAALYGRLEIIRYLMTEHQDTVDLHHTDKQGRNVLFYCIPGSQLSVLRYFVDEGVRCVVDQTGATNLMHACLYADSDIIEFFLSNASLLQLDINAVDERNENALFDAVRSCRSDIVKRLLDAGLEIISNVEGVNVISLALHNGMDAILELLLKHAVDVSEFIGQRDGRGRTVFHYFIEQSNTDLLKTFRQQIVDYYQNSDQSENLLMYACQRSHDKQYEIVRFLVEDIGLSTNNLDSKNRSALFYAIESGNVQVVSYLLVHLDHVTSDCKGLSPLMVAVASGNSAMVEVLLQSRYYRQLINRTDKHGRNEVHYCAMHDCVQILEMLSFSGSNLDLQDSEGRTPLMYASENGRFQIVAQLLRRSRNNVDISDNKGRTALHHCVASSNASLKCVRLLISYMADVNLADNLGLTPLMIACQTCSVTNIPLIRIIVQEGDADPVLQDNQGLDAFDHCPFDAKYVRALLQQRSYMPKTEQNVLKAYVDELSEKLHVTSVLRNLMHENIITRALHFEVMKQQPGERVKKLIEILFTRGQNAFRAFCTVLKTEGETILAFEMTKQAYHKENEIYW